MASTATDKSVAELEEEIITQTAIFNDLRAQGSPLDEVKKQLGDLKKALALAKGAGKEKEKKTEGSTSQPKKKERLLLKTAKVHSSRLFFFSCIDND